MPTLPAFDADAFVPGAPIDNPYFPLLAGQVRAYRAEAVDDESGDVETHMSRLGAKVDGRLRPSSIEPFVVPAMSLPSLAGTLRATSFRLTWSMPGSSPRHSSCCCWPAGSSRCSGSSAISRRRSRRNAHVSRPSMATAAEQRSSRRSKRWRTMTSLGCLPASAVLPTRRSRVTWPKHRLTVVGTTCRPLTIPSMTPASRHRCGSTTTAGKQLSSDIALGVRVNGDRVS